MKAVKTIFVIILIFSVSLCGLLFTGCSNSSSSEDELKSFFRVDSEKDLKLQNKTVTIDYDGETKILPDKGYDGLGIVEIVTEPSSNVPATKLMSTLYLHSQKAVLTDHGKNWHPDLPNVVCGDAIVYYLNGSGGYAYTIIENGLTTTVQILNGSPIWVFSSSPVYKKNCLSLYDDPALDATLDLDGVEGYHIDTFGDAWLTVTPNLFGLATGRDDCTFEDEISGSILHTNCYELKAPPAAFEPYDN